MILAGTSVLLNSNVGRTDLFIFTALYAAGDFELQS